MLFHIFAAICETIACQRISTNGAPSITDDTAQPAQVSVCAYASGPGQHGAVLVAVAVAKNDDLAEG
jgi:hypothetical protein